MIPVLDGTGTAGKSVLEGTELQTALTAIVTAVNAPSGTQPLPTGAATQTTLAAILTALGSPAQAGAVVTSVGYQVTATTTVTRPADTTAYTAGDAIANSTSSPTAGGFTLTGMARTSGGAGVLTDLIVVSSDTAAMQGEVWIYDSAVTAPNDNAAMSVSDADQLKLVAKVPFTLVAETNNAVAHVQNLSIGYTCIGSADLRFLLKATGGTLTTASAGTFTVRAKGIGNN
jgi:hypothetical protein